MDYRKNLFPFLISILFFCSNFAKGADNKETDLNPNVQRVYKSDGNHRCGFSVLVGSNSSIDLYSISGGTDTRSIRTVLVINPSSNYDLYVATFPNFNTSIDNCWIVPSGSGSWTTSNHQNFNMKYPPMAPKENVRGNVESE